jgi:hypothetical protein
MHWAWVHPRVLWPDLHASCVSSSPGLEGRSAKPQSKSLSPLLEHPSLTFRKSQTAWRSWEMTAHHSKCDTSLGRRD